MAVYCLTLELIRGADYAFRDVKNILLFPSVGMKRLHAHLEANFGQRPFVYDIDGMVKVCTSLKSVIGRLLIALQKVRQATAERYRAADISTLHPPLDRADICKALVAQYLSHEGYNETAEAFARAARAEHAHFYPTGAVPELPLEPHLFHGANNDVMHRQGASSSLLKHCSLLTWFRNTFCYPRWRR